MQRNVIPAVVVVCDLKISSEFKKTSSVYQAKSL